jgi:hypothetical protein
MISVEGNLTNSVFGPPTFLGNAAMSPPLYPSIELLVVVLWCCLELRCEGCLLLQFKRKGPGALGIGAVLSRMHVQHTSRGHTYVCPRPYCSQGADLICIYLWVVLELFLTVGKAPLGPNGGKAPPRKSVLEK